MRQRGAEAEPQVGSPPVGHGVGSGPEVYSWKEPPAQVETGAHLGRNVPTEAPLVQKLNWKNQPFLGMCLRVEKL